MLSFLPLLLLFLGITGAQSYKFHKTNIKPLFELPIDSKKSNWKTYTVPHLGPGQDDAVPLLATLNSGNFSTNSTILFKKGVTYNISTPILFPKFNNVEIKIEGNISLPEDMNYIKSVVASSTFPGHWFKFSGGTNVILRGTTDPKWGWVDAHGQQWWDKMDQVNRPHGWSFASITNGIIRDMKLWKPIAWNFNAAGSNNIHAFHNQIYALSDSDGFPFNTDGFSPGGSNMLFEENYIQNGDDCITVGSGAKNIHFRNTYCEGGHGLSIGSLGKGGSVADVQNVLIENVHMQSTLYGARFKSWTGGNGLARNITWRDISFDDVPFPIYVTQNYWDQGLGPKPNNTSTNNTNIQDMLFDGFTGTIRNGDYVEGTCITDPCWYTVANATGREVVIFDLYPNTATNIKAVDLHAKLAEGKGKVAVMCDPATVTSDVGFKCIDGTYSPT